MKHLFAAIRWDFLRQSRYRIISAAAIVHLLYVLVLWNLPAGEFDWLAVFMIFNDPVGLGMLFIGALYLFEKSENTLQALRVTPLRPWQYLVSKVATLSAVALAGSLAIAWAVWGWRFSCGWLIAGAGLSASLFIALGLCLAVRSRNFNDYLLRSIALLIPSALPLLNFFGFTDTYWWYLLPSQGSIILLEAAYASVEAWRIGYALAYLLGFNIGAFALAIRLLEQAAKTQLP